MFPARWSKLACRKSDVIKVSQIGVGPGAWWTENSRGWDRPVVPSATHRVRVG